MGTAGEERAVRFSRKAQEEETGKERVLCKLCDTSTLNPTESSSPPTSWIKIPTGYCNITAFVALPFPSSNPTQARLGII